MKTLKDEIRDHNQNVKKEIEKAKQGQIICLTNMMINREKLQEKVETVERATKGR